MKRTIFAFIFVFGFLFTQYANADWAAPTQNPPSGNISTPINVGSTGQTKLGGLTLNTGGATYGLLVPYGKVGFGTLTPSGLFEIFGIGQSGGSESIFNVTSGGKVGVGVQSPASLLSVAGGLQVGDDTATCTTAKAGTLRYHGSVIQFCNGTTWAQASAASSGETIPVGAVRGYCELKDHYGDVGTNLVRSCVTTSVSDPAWCSTSADSCSCDTGYTLTDKRVFTEQVCGGFFGNCDKYTYITVCVRNTTPIQASCPATGGCPKTKGGDTCVTNSMPSSPSCSSTSITSTCNDGTWSVTPGVYSTCTYGAQQSASCGAANQSYAYEATGFTGSFCGGAGVASPSNPSFPSAGSGVSWTCAESGKITVSCSASHIAAPVYGCTDPVAENYNSNATADNGSCTYIDGCMDPSANNYDPTATRQPNDVCTYNE